MGHATSLCIRLALAPALCLVLACGRSADSPEPSRALLKDGALNLSIVVSKNAGQAGRMAADDLAMAAARRCGLTEPSPLFYVPEAVFDPASAGTDMVVLAGVLPEGGESMLEGDWDPRTSQGYAIREERIGAKIVLRVESPSSIGLAYGLYQLADDLGARWYHPRESFYPSAPDALWPTGYEELRWSEPATRLRGFHQHTQHPIVWAEFLLNPKDEYKAYVTEYLRYLLRNRQNVLEWHMLSTVDMAAWTPYAAWITDEAHRHGVKASLTLSFVDRQQNNYRLVPDLGNELDMPARLAHQQAQVAVSLDAFSELGFDIFLFQYGATEMHALSDAETLGWFEAASTWKAANAPEMELFSWVHTPSQVLAEDGETPFFHLALDAPADIGLFIHTTMFYDLEHAAPVYGNANFSHQQRLFSEGKGARPVAYFPESAWWLGFDNTCPIFLPITNYSRAWDVQEVIPPLMGDVPLDGHITFTTGIEWNYWMFDHYLTRLTWDEDLSWEAYTLDVAELYGGAADAVAEALEGITRRQVADFYEGEPGRFFYMAGESEHDELGEAAGLGARPTKLAFWDVVNFDDEAFEAWQLGDYAWMKDTAQAYEALAEPLLGADPGGGEATRVRLFELVSSVEITAWRVRHVEHLYAAVIAGREGDEEEAYAELELARAITEQVKARVAEVEARVYRYPLELSAAEFPESLTGYPFGYAWETHTAHFWARRDEQVQLVLDVTFGHVVEEFSIDLVSAYRSVKASTEVIEPDVSSATKGLLLAYMPTLLVALGAPDGDSIEIAIAEDLNGNGLPDISSEKTGSAPWPAEELSLGFDVYKVAVGPGGQTIGHLTLLDGSFLASLSEQAVSEGELAGDVAFADILALLVATGMFDEDEAWQMVADQFGVDPDASPRPTDFPFRIRMNFEVLVP